MSENDPLKEMKLDLRGVNQLRIESNLPAVHSKTVLGVGNPILK